MKFSISKTLVPTIGMICVAVLLTAPAQGQLPPPFPYHAVPVRIVSENSGKCLRIRGGDLQNHARAEQYNCAYSNDWWLVPAGPNYYRVIASHSGANLDLRMGLTGRIRSRSGSTTRCPTTTTSRRESARSKGRSYGL